MVNFYRVPLGPWSHQQSIFRSAHWIERFVQTRMAPYWWWKMYRRISSEKLSSPQKNHPIFQFQKKIHHRYVLLHKYSNWILKKTFAIFPRKSQPQLAKPQTVRASQQAPSARRGNSPTNAAESGSHTFGRFLADRQIFFLGDLNFWKILSVSILYIVFYLILINFP